MGKVKGTHRASSRGKHRQAPAVWEKSRMRRWDKSLPGPGWFSRCISIQDGAWTSESKDQTLHRKEPERPLRPCVQVKGEGLVHSTQQLMVIAGRRTHFGFPSTLVSPQDQPQCLVYTNLSSFYLQDPNTHTFSFCFWRTYWGIIIVAFLRGTLSQEMSFAHPGISNICDDRASSHRPCWPFAGVSKSSGNQACFYLHCHFPGPHLFLGTQIQART